MAYAVEAKNLLESGKYEAAIKELSSAIDLDPTIKEKRTWYMWLGQAYESLNLWPKALEAYEQAVTLAPKEWQRYITLGRVYAKTDLVDLAIGTYEKALHLSARVESTAFFELGKLYRKRGDMEKARIMVEKYLAAKPNSEEATIELSKIYEEEGKTNEALVLAQKSAGTNKSYNNAVRLGDLYGENGELEKAKEAYMQAEGKPAASLRYGLAAWQNGKSEIAETALTEYLASRPQEPLALFFRALSRLELGKLSGAKEDAKIALAQAPPESRLKEYCEILYEQLSEVRSQKSE